MDILATVVLLSFLAFSHGVNTGRNTRRRKQEIAWGEVVDYSSMRRNYPFMARLILDDLRCGGALISDRYIVSLDIFLFT